MSQNPQKLGYIHNADIRETIDKVENHIEVTNNRYQTIENFHNEIDNVQDSLNMQADNAIQRMDSISQKIKNYVNDLKNNSKLDFDLSEYTEYLESLDISTIQQEKYTKLENFIKNRKPIEESIYKHDISPITDKDLTNPNRILTKNTLININFHEKANDDVFNKIPYGLGRWEDAMLENRDKVLQIPINNNLKSFEFGIKYTQKFSCVEDKDKKLERYFAGKITLTGLLSNSDGQDKIPFDIKGVIYNADYDNTGLLGPKMTFKIACDKKYVYIWLDKVEPYRMIPVLDKSNEADNSVVLNMIDMAEANLSINYSNKNFTNYYVSETEKLNLDERIGVNYSVSMSVYDTTAFDISNENNCMKIIDFDNSFIENVINNNNIFKKGDFEVKPVSMGYTQLIGYGLSQTLNNPTNVVPENKVFEYRNFDMIEHDGSRIHKLPPMSRQIWDLIEPDKRIQTDIRPEAFRRCGIIDNDPDTDYWYMWVEEDIYMNLSRYNTAVNFPTPLFDDSKDLAKMITLNDNLTTNTTVTGITMFGKHGSGNRGFLCMDYQGIHSEKRLLKNLSTRGWDSSKRTADYTEKNINRYNLTQNMNMSTISERCHMGHFYDEYTGYWYFVNTNHDWVRTKGWKKDDYEVLNVKANITKINSANIGGESTFSKMATDGNGRFVVFQFVNATTAVVLVYENGDFSSPIIAKQITFANNISNTKWNGYMSSPYHSTLSTDKKGTWWVVIYSANNTANTPHPYFISTDDGENWIRSDVRDVNNCWYLLPHPSEDRGVFMGYHGAIKEKLASAKPEPWLTFLFQPNLFTDYNTSLSRARIYSRYPCDVERNNKEFQQIYMEAFGCWYFSETVPVSISSENFGTVNVIRNNFMARKWHTLYPIENSLNTNTCWANNFVYDEVNDLYYTGNGTNGFMCLDYAHTCSHMFTVNRIYRVSKYDYAVQLIKNYHLDQNSAPTTFYDYNNSDKSVRYNRKYGSCSATKTYSNTNDGFYNYLHGSLAYKGLRYYRRNKTLYGREFGGLKVTESTITPVKGTFPAAPYNLVWIPKINAYISAPTNKCIFRYSSLDHSGNDTGDGIVLVLKDKHLANVNRNSRYGTTPLSVQRINRSENLNDLYYDEKNDTLYALGEYGIHIFKNPKLNKIVTATDQTTYDDDSYTFVEYPQLKEIRDLQAAGQPIPISRWIDLNGIDPHRWIRFIVDEEQNKLVFVIGEAFTYWLRYQNEMKFHGLNEEYDRKYWKGFMVFDMETRNIQFISEAFKQPGDHDDIDFIDVLDSDVININTLWGRDAEGTYIVSPRTGNIYSVLDGWTRFEKRECDYKMTQVIYNNKRNSYITFVNNTPTEYSKNRYTRPQIREIPLTDIDYKIKPERSQEVRDSIIKEIRKVAQKTNSEVFFKLEISIKPGKTYEDRYLLFYEDGVFAPNEENNMIMRYFVPDVVAGHKYTEATEGKNKYFTDFDLVKGYRMKNLNKIFSKIPGLRNRKWSEQIKMPLEDMEKLMKMPTKVKLTIYPTSGKMYNVDCAVNRNNTYSNKIYFGNVTENSKK